jgi:hypothetical protein
LGAAWGGRRGGSRQGGDGAAGAGLHESAAVHGIVPEFLDS